MPQKRHSAEAIVAKLRQVDVLLGRLAAALLAASRSAAWQPPIATV